MIPCSKAFPKTSTTVNSATQFFVTVIQNGQDAEASEAGQNKWGTDAATQELSPPLTHAASLGLPAMVSDSFLAIMAALISLRMEFSGLVSHHTSLRPIKLLHMKGSKLPRIFKCTSCLTIPVVFYSMFKNPCEH